jgi:hypothetical protein
VKAIGSRRSIAKLAQALVRGWSALSVTGLEKGNSSATLIFTARARAYRGFIAWKPRSRLGWGRNTHTRKLQELKLDTAQALSPQTSGAATKRKKRCRKKKKKWRLRENKARAFSPVDQEAARP